MSYNQEIAFKQLVQFTEKQNYDPLPYFYLGDLFYRHSDWGQATQNYRNALYADPSVAEAYFGLERIAYLKNQPDLALKNFTKAFDLSYWT